MIHGFFKALLFLGAGSIIVLLHHEHDIFKMGGLRRKIPAIFWTFLIGSASLAAAPFITGGFYSKDQIVWNALASEKGNAWFLVAALTGAFVTSLYTFKMVFATFFGTEKTHLHHHRTGMLMTLPLIVLAVLSTFGGFIELPHTFGHLQLFTDHLAPVLPAVNMRSGIESSEWVIQLIAGALSSSGVYLAYLFYVQRPAMREEVKSSVRDLYNLAYHGFGFDRLYDHVFVRPFGWIAKVNKSDVVDELYNGLVNLTGFFHRAFAWTQSGIMRWYMMGIVIGTILVVTISLLITV